LRVLEGVAVALAGGGEQEAGVVGAGDFEEIAGGGGAGLEGFDGVVEIVLGAGERGEMKDSIEGSVEGEGLADVMLDEREAGVASEVGNVGGTARNEIVEADYRVAVSEKPIDEMGTDKSGGSGDEDMHSISVG
jgi:hypothetical protein